MPILQIEISDAVLVAIQREADRRQVAPRELMSDLVFDRLLQLVESNRRATDVEALADAEKVARKAYHDSIRPKVTVVP